MLAGCSDPSTIESVAVEAQTTQDTYLGKIEYQDHTITKASAAKENLGFSDDEVVIGTYEGYEAVYPFVTAS